jgi:ComF family protein
MELLPLLKKISHTHFSTRSIKKQRFFNLYNLGLLTLSRCDLCGLSCHHYKQLCQNCYHDLPLFQMAIVQGDLLNWPEIYQHLPQISFDQLICLAPHGYPFDHWLSQFKYKKRFELAELFSHLLSDLLKDLLKKEYLPQPDIMITVPLHITRWQSRGYNQAHLIAQKLQNRLSNQYNIKYIPQLLSRTKKTATQVGQKGSQRRKNLNNAFSVTSKQPLPEHIMLIDDVVTTGATASEIGRLLKQYGVKRITLVTLTLAMPNTN